MCAYNMKGNDTLFARFDTFRKRKRTKQEIEDLTREGKEAMENTVNALAEDPKTYELEEGQSREFSEKPSLRSKEIKELSANIVQWVNSLLVDDRILVRNLEEDLFDGQVLQKVVEKLSGKHIDYPEVTQTEFGQLQRLREVLKIINEVLEVPPHLAEKRWSAKRIYEKDHIATLRILIHLAKRFKAPFRIPPDIYVTVIVVSKVNGTLEFKRKEEFLTEPLNHDLPDGFNFDADQHPLDKVSDRTAVIQDLLEFANSYLMKMNIRLSVPARDLADGTKLILLIGLIENFFVPLHVYHLHPTTYAESLANLTLAFQLMQDSGLSDPSTTPEDLLGASAQDDYRPALRLLYSLYSHYRNYYGEEQVISKPAASTNEEIPTGGVGGTHQVIGIPPTMNSAEINYVSNNMDRLRLQNQNYMSPSQHPAGVHHMYPEELIEEPE